MVRPHPNPIVPQQQTRKSPESALNSARVMAKDPELINLSQKVIDEYKLPYIIKILADGTGELTPTLSQGEMFLSKFITEDKATLLLKDYVCKIAPTEYECLITGETGTGKEILGCAMIGNREGSIVKVNCAGLPRELIESELFGHTKGSFTGAYTEKKGLMSVAENGVMFLDEIGELPIDIQGKLLRALQEKTIRKVGGFQEEKINCKFVCATNRDLQAMVKDGLFRKDLYARISTLELDIKPLRERQDDILPITRSLPKGEEFCEKFGDDLIGGKLDTSLNVRSLLQHVIRYIVLGTPYIK